MQKLKSVIEYRVVKDTEIKYVSFSYDEALKKFKAMKRRDKTLELIGYATVVPA